MKIIKKITYIATLSFVMLLGVFFQAPAASAQTCTASSTVGNLFGYILASGIDGPIYVSTESWNDDPLSYGNTTSSYDFYVNYDRTSNLWSGRAWHGQAGNEGVGWIEFDSGALDKQAFVENVTNGVGDWGNWDGMIDLNDVAYSTNSGGFIGTGVSFDYTGDPAAPVADILVGLGEFDFSNVSFVESPCNEHVNLFLNNTPNLHFNTCSGQVPTIKWTSENVDNCETDIGFWGLPNPGSRPFENTSGETASAGLNIDSVQQFILKCIGNASGSIVYGVAALSCGTEDPIDSESIIIPIFIEA